MDSDIPTDDRMLESMTLCALCENAFWLEDEGLLVSIHDLHSHKNLVALCGRCLKAIEDTQAGYKAAQM